MIPLQKMTPLAQQVARAKFDAIWVSDHFHPWFDTNASEYNSWIWMTHAMGQIDIPFGTAVTAPLFRYHPAITAQAFATLEAIYGHRVILGIGTGEAMNEVPLGFDWPKYPERRDRLIEAVQIIRSLWGGESVDFEGSYYRLRSAKLYLKADVPIVMSAMGPRMARIAGKYGDGVMMLAKTPAYINEVLMPKVRQGVAEGSKSFDEILKVIEIDMAYDPDYDKAIQAMRKWAAELLDEVFNTAIYDPRDIERRGESVTDEQLAKVFPIATDEESLIHSIEQYFECGFDHAFVQLNTHDDEKAIDLFGKKVLPYFRERKETRK